MAFDALARAFERRLRCTDAPRARLRIIITFLDASAGVPDAWLHAYAASYLPHLAQLVRLPGMDGFSSSAWRRTLDSLDQALRLGWKSDIDLPRAREAALHHLVLACGYAGELRQLEALLVAEGCVPAPLLEDEWSAIFAAGTTPWMLFSAFVDRMHRIHPAADAILKRSHERWSEQRRQGRHIFVILLEDRVDPHPGEGSSPQREDALLRDGTSPQQEDAILRDGTSPQQDAREGRSDTSLLGEEDDGYEGSVLPLEIVSESTTTTHILFEHAFAQESLESIAQLEQALAVAQGFLRERVGVPPMRTLLVRFREIPSAVTGGSLGLAAAAALAIHLSQLMNARLRWSASSATALIGSLDADGEVRASSPRLVAAKIRAALYSPIETLAVPAAHREMAVELVQRLMRHRPNRSLRVIGVTRLEDCLAARDAFALEQRNPYDRVGEFVVRAQTPLLVALIVLATVIAAFFAWKAWYDFPNLEESLGLQVRSNAIVYNPRDSLEWCLRDYHTVVQGAIPFGDLEVGDGFSRNFWIWNMTPVDKMVALSIEGPDSSDWYLNWRYGVQRLPRTKDHRISVMFAPLTPGVDKHAALVLRDPESGDELYRLPLRGAAGQPLPAGYALQFDGKDDMVFFGSNASEFDRQEGTFELWFRSQGRNTQTIIHNGGNPPDGDAYVNLSLRLNTQARTNDRGLCIEIGTTTFFPDRRGDGETREGVWTHLAIAWSVKKHAVRLYIDGEERRRSDEEFVLEGEGKPFVSIGAYYDGTTNRKHFFRGEMDGIRLWDHMLEPADIRAVMHRRQPVLRPDLAAAWEFDALGEVSMYASDGGAHDAELIGRPAFVRSSAPINDGSVPVRLVAGPNGSTATELGPGIMLDCQQFVFPRHTDGAIAFWYRNDGGTIPVFGMMNNGGNPLFCTSRGDLEVMTIRGHRDNGHVRPGWNHVVLNSSRKGWLDVWHNGVLCLSGPDEVPEPEHDWHVRFEGLQLGMQDDGYNQFGSDQFAKIGIAFMRPRAVASLALWHRLLAPDEIRAMWLGGPIPKSSLKSWWPLTSLPGADANYRDRVRGLLLHLRRVQPR